MYFFSYCISQFINQVNEAERKLYKIAELKDHFEDNDLGYDDHLIATEQPETEGPQLLFGSNKYATKSEIIASIPSRRIVDRLVSTYFSGMDMPPGEVFSFSFWKIISRHQSANKQFSYP